MKYSIGDRVKIRENLVVGKIYYHGRGSAESWVYTREMHRPVVNNGYVGTIIGIIESCGYGYGYRLNIAPNQPYFNDAMIEGYAKEVELNTEDILRFLEG